APTMRLALSAPDDHSVDPRVVLGALRTACELEGVAVREHAAVARIELDGAGKRVDGVRLADGERVSAAAVVLAAGPRSGGLPRLPAAAGLPGGSVKGPILRLL